MTDPSKDRVREYWDQLSCDTQVATSPKFSLEYFEQIEEFRYADQPFIHSFAQFTRYRGKRVLEVGFGAGTDFIQWLRAGAFASGIDLTNEALANLRARVAAYNLPQPEQIQVDDAEALPFASHTFDLGYSFGVLHHSPNMEKALAELIRVVRPGGEIKVMLYNRHSIYVWNRWLRFALLRGEPFQSLTAVVAKYIENAGTKAYTRGELKSILEELPLMDITIHTEITSADYLSSSAVPVLNQLYRFALRCGGYSRWWDRTWYVERLGDQPIKPTIRTARNRQNVIFSGNPFGFFHCIRAKKAA